MSLADEHCPDVRFIVTGFGPFQGVPSNPTSLLVDGLVEYLAGSGGRPDLARMTQTRLIETSAIAAKACIDDLCKQQQHLRSAVTIVLHLGVDYAGEKFQLESCAYNDATFRVPDERGYQPKGVSIIDDENIKFEVGRTLQTVLNVHDLVMRMEDVISSVSDKHEAKCGVMESTDPGRFVCNYTYCYSMYKFQASSMISDRIVVPNHGSDEEKPSSTFQSTSSAKCLFLHVPPVTVVPIDQQLWFVSQLISVLNSQEQQTAVASAQTGV